MHRFFVPPQAIHNGQVAFPEEIARQMRSVLRLRPGQPVLVLDNLGMEYEVELQVVEPGSALGMVRLARPAGGEPRTRLTLYLGLTQREKFEWMLQKCTEVGAAAFVPVVTQRCLVQDPGESEKKLPRWQKIVQEAAEQCGRGRIPLILPSQRLDAALRGVPEDAVRLVAWEEEHTLDLRKALRNLEMGTRPLVALVGPEGGLAESEIRSILAAGFQAVTLGPRILRMETAAVVLAALALHELGE